jgi:hypothetical protein
MGRFQPEPSRPNLENVKLEKRTYHPVPLSESRPCGLRCRLYASGAAGEPITITAYGSGVAPILSNPGDTNNDESVLALHGSFIVIDGIQIRNRGQE